MRIVVVIFAIILTSVALMPPEYDFTSSKPEPVCYTEYIPYETKEVEDDSFPADESPAVTQEGEDGVQEICTLDSEPYSDEIISEPVTEIITYGTYEEPITMYNYGNYRVGAWCMDGTWSDAIGSGACSWHGGVYEWVYE